MLDILIYSRSLAREDGEDDLLKPNTNHQHSLVPDDSDASSEEDSDAGEEHGEAEDDEDMERITDALGNTVLRPRVKV